MAHDLQTEAAALIPACRPVDVGQLLAVVGDRDVQGLAVVRQSQQAGATRVADGIGDKFGHDQDGVGRSGAFGRFQPSSRDAAGDGRTPQAPGQSQGKGRHGGR